MHLDLISHARRRLRVLKILHGILLVDIVLGTSRGLRAWIGVDGSNSLAGVICVLVLSIWWAQRIITVGAAA